MGWTQLWKDESWYDAAHKSRVKEVFQTLRRELHLQGFCLPFENDKVLRMIKPYEDGYLVVLVELRWEIEISFCLLYPGSNASRVRIGRFWATNGSQMTMTGDAIWNCIRGKVADPGPSFEPDIEDK